VQAIAYLPTPDLRGNQQPFTGGGLKASFLYENDFDTRFDAYGAGAVNNGTVGALSGGVKIGPTNFGSNGGEQFLNLEGGFGKIALGEPVRNFVCEAYHVTKEHECRARHANRR
jgi:hypothetical protein